MTRYSVLDAALERISASGPDLSNGFANHAPMAIEALCALGRGDAALPWLERNWRYRSMLLPRRKPAQAVADWEAALGNNRPEDWSVFLDGDFSAGNWRIGLAHWTRRLSPGASAAALHGIIRVGHAARGLQDRVTPLRLRELRDAFAYWAAHYHTLPSAPGTVAPLPAAAAILRVRPAPAPRQRRAGAITTALGILVEDPDFPAVIDLLDVGDDPGAVLSDVTETFARVYLANAVDGIGVITFIHGVTGAVALRSLLQFLSLDQARTTLRHLWQAGAALYAALGVASPVAEDVAPPDESIAALIDRAVATGDEHAIKFTEALLREYAIRPRPVYLAAAAHAIDALS